MRSLRNVDGGALVALIVILVGLPLAALGYQFFLRPAMASVRIIDIVAAVPEAGGFQPDAIRIPAGETVRLRFSAPDVTHGIAIGPGLGLDLGHVDPGEVQEAEVTFDQPGRYSYYCNTWCSPNHWRMRGTIEVYDPDKPEALIVDGAGDPVLEALSARGIDIDAPHVADALPSVRPSAERGAAVVQQLDDGLPAALLDSAWRRGHSPEEAWASLVRFGFKEEDAWDVVAYLWLSEMDAPRLDAAAALYAKNCAACHGESGDGRGPGADALAAQGLAADIGMGMPAEPTAFVDPRTMLGGTGETYYAKLRRGGMGTGMPGFGSLFTPEETWALVNYLWLFAFKD